MVMQVGKQIENELCFICMSSHRSDAVVCIIYCCCLVLGGRLVVYVAILVIPRCFPDNIFLCEYQTSTINRRKRMLDIVWTHSSVIHGRFSLDLVVCLIIVTLTLLFNIL